MSEIGQNLKNIVMKGIDLIGSKASDLASTAKQKVDAFNLENQKKDLLAELGNKVFEMSKEGTEFPEALKPLMESVLKVEEELNELTASNREEADDENKAPEGTEKSAYNDVPETEEKAAEELAAAEYTAKDDSDVPVLRVEKEEEQDKADESCPLSSAINDLFENVPQVDKMVDKVNTSLDELGDNLLKFSGEFGKKLDDFTDELMGKKDK